MQGHARLVGHLVRYGIPYHEAIQLPVQYALAMVDDGRQDQSAIQPQSPVPLEPETNDVVFMATSRRSQELSDEQ